MVSAIVLDLDDTLALEVEFVRSGFGAVSYAWREYVPEAVTQRLCWEAFRSSRHGVLDRVGQQLGLDDDVVMAAVDTYRTHRPAIALCPDADRFLDRVGLKRLAVVSDGNPRTQSMKVEALG